MVIDATAFAGLISVTTIFMVTDIHISIYSVNCFQQVLEYVINAFLSTKSTIKKHYKKDILSQLGKNLHLMNNVSEKKRSPVLVYLLSRHHSILQ